MTAQTQAKVVSVLRTGPQTARTIAAAIDIPVGYVDLVLRRLAARGSVDVAGRGERHGARGRFPMLWKLA